MKSLLTLFAVVFLMLSLSAQRDETLFGSNGLKFTGAWGGFTESINQFDDDYGHVSGAYGLVEFNKSLTIGWGGYRLIDEVHSDIFDDLEFDLWYHGLIIGYGYKPSNVIHPQFNILFGGGEADIVGERADRIYVVKPEVGMEINVFKWFRVGLNAGYRVVAGTDIVGLEDTDLSSPFGELNFKFGWSWGR